MKSKIVPVSEAMEHIKDGMTVMVGGFLGHGTPEALIDGMVEKGLSDLTLVCNDTAMPGVGMSKLIATKKVKKLIATHIGTNPQTGELMGTGELDVELTPQGTLAEKIRAAGCGLGGVLTPTGLGTDVAAGKQVLEIDGKEYLLEKPLHGDVAVLKGSVVDKLGNVYYNGTTKNFCPLMAMACETVIVEAEKLVEPGEIRPEDVMTPSIFVDYIVVGGAN